MNTLKKFRKKYGYLFPNGLMRQVDLAKLMHMCARQIQSIEAGSTLKENRRLQLEELGRKLSKGQL